MSNEIRHVLMTYEGATPDFQPIESGNPVKLAASGNLKVPFGEHRIRFDRVAESSWHFSGFRYKADPAGAVGPLTSIEMTASYIEVLDDNQNQTKQSQEFRYEIQVTMADRSPIWIDPVIENEPGGPAPSTSK